MIFDPLEKYDFQQILAEISAGLSTKIKAPPESLMKNREFILGACFMAHSLDKCLPALIVDKCAIEALKSLAISVLKNFGDDIVGLYSQTEASQ